MTDVSDTTYDIFVISAAVLLVEAETYKKTMPFPCPHLFLFLYTVAWWVNVTPLQLPPTRSPPRPIIHPAPLPTHLTHCAHSDVRGRGARCCHPQSASSPLPPPTPTHVFAGFLLHWSFVSSAGYCSREDAQWWCRSENATVTGLLRRCDNSVTPSSIPRSSTFFFPALTCGSLICSLLKFTCA